MFDFVELPKRKTFRLTLRALFLLIGVVAAFFTSIALEEKMYGWAMLPASIILFASLAEFVLADILTENIYPATTERILQKLETNLRGVHDKILESLDKTVVSLCGCDQSKISGTFHLKIDLYSPIGDESKPALVQVTDYSGTLGGKRWRFNDDSKGIIGRCLRTRNQEYVNFRSAEEYRERMIKEFGFSSDEVNNKHTKQARSYLAQPVFSKSKLIGIIYLFSTETQIFPIAVNNSALQNTANEIAAYLEGSGIVS